jgi:hypothetical protein
MAVILVFFMVLAALGFALSLLVHGSTLLGIDLFGNCTWGLHIGIFVVWFPAVLVSSRLAKDFKHKDFWKAALRGCPSWMRWNTYLFFGYAFFNFFFTLFLLFKSGTSGGSDSGPDPLGFRLFSGHWMVFYSTAFAILYSALRVRASDAARRCMNGHPLSPADKFCPECGAPAGEANSEASDIVL